MAEITGGELNYIVTADVDQLKKSMSDGENRIMGFTEVAEKAGTTLQNSFDKSGNKVKDFTGIVRENISIQKQVIKELEGQIKEIYDRASGMAPGISQATILDSAKGIEKELAGEKAALADLEIQISKTAVSSTTLGTKLAEAKNRLAELNLAAKEGKEVTADQFREAEAEVKKYGEAISDTNARTKALTAGTIGSLAQGLSLVTGTMAMGTSLMGAFGGKSEELNQIMLKTQALLAATVTLQEIKNTTIQKGGVISGIMTIQEIARARATNLAAAGTLRATIAQRALNLVANANPYILLATAIITVVGALALYAAGSSKAAKTTQELNKKMADSVAEPIIAYKKLQLQWNALGQDLKSKEKFIKDNKDAFQELGVSVNNVSDAEKVFVKNSSNVMAAMMIRAKAAAAMQLATEQYKKALTAQMENEQEQKILKSGSTTEKAVVRLKINSRFTPLKEEVNSGFSTANNLIARSAGYSKAELDLIKKSGLKPYEEIEKEKKALKEKNKPTAKQVGEEFFPPGSVAEIEKRLSAIDEALSKATAKGSIESLKIKRIAAAEELAEALKKIEIKSLEDRAAAQEKYSEAYNIIAELNGKEAAEKMYGALMEGAQSYYGWLTNEQDKLLQKGGILSQTDRENLVFLTQKINEIQGQKNAFQNFADGIDEALAKIPTLSGQLDFLQNKAEERLSTKGNKSFDDGEQKYLKDKQDALLKQQRADYQQMLDEQQSYEEKSLHLAKEYAAVKATEQYKNASSGERAKIDQSFSDKQGVLDIDMIQKSAEWQVAFSELEGMTNTSLQLILQRLLEFQAKSKGTLSLQDSAELQKAIENVQNAANKNPFQKLTANFSNYRNTLQASRKAQQEYNKVLRETPDDAKKVADAGAKMVEADKKALEAKKKLLGQLQEAQNIFNAVGQGVMDLGDAFGGFDDATNDAIGNIMDIGNAAFDLGKSIATGDVAGMISAGVKLIGSIGKALNGDQKKEREIRRQAASIKILEIAYNDLSFAADRAFGSMKYDGQRDLIKNLEQQKILLQGMLATEASKKKADKEKMAGYQSQIQQINQSIAQIKEGIIRDVLQTDLVDAAAKLGDALVNNFGRGEDAIKSLENTANDMVKNLLRNQLNLALQNKMKPILDQLLASSGFNQDGTGSFKGLTPEQIAAFKAQVVAAGQSMQGFLDGYSEIFGALDPADAQGLKGDIKGITEKTAGALEGQINAMRILQADMHNISKNNQQTFIASLQNLVMIEYNTRRLHSIDDGIKELNSKIKKGLAGLP